MSMNIEATRVIRPPSSVGLRIDYTWTPPPPVVVHYFMVCEIRIIATTRRHGPWQINSRRQHVGGCAGLCSSYSSDSVNELKRIKTRSQTFTQPCASGWRSGQQNHTTRCWCWRGRRPLTKYKQAIYINLRLAPSMTTNRGIVPLLWALRGLVDQETTTTTRQRSTFIIIMVNVVFPVMPQKNNNQDACRHG